MEQVFLKSNSTALSIASACKQDAVYSWQNWNLQNNDFYEEMNEESIFSFTFTASSMSLLYNISISHHCLVPSPMVHIYQKSLEFNFLRLSIQEIISCIARIDIDETLKENIFFLIYFET